VLQRTIRGGKDSRTSGRHLLRDEEKIPSWNGKKKTLEVAEKGCRHSQGSQMEGKGISAKKRANGGGGPAGKALHTKRRPQIFPKEHPRRSPKRWYSERQLGVKNSEENIRGLAQPKYTLERNSGTQETRGRLDYT